VGSIIDRVSVAGAHFDTSRLAGSDLPGFFTLVPHEIPAQRSLRFILIVRAASEPQPFHGGGASTSNRLRVIEFQKAPLPAAMTASADERASPLVALPNGPANSDRDVAAG